MPGDFMMYVFLGISLLAVIAYGIRFCKSKFSPVTSVKATVVNKQKTETFSKYSGSGRHTKYAVIFSVNGKKLSFYVSEFSYGGYRIGETATLTYKADKLLDFS